jgi:subtilisin family serine protease
MDLGKYPGLGIRSLHAQGITGRGVGIAIIDQTLLVDHQEYAGQLRLYEETDDVVGEWSASQLHGAAVASIAVGKTVGVAPEADLYYIATARGFTNNSFTYLARSIQRILEINGQLPPENKIRVISMSLHWVEGAEGYDELMAAVGEAKGAGMLIVCANIEQVHGFKFQGLGRSPLADPAAFESYEPGLSWANDFYAGERPSDRLLVPMDSRTTASPTGQIDYVFLREGGLSWSIPYIAGLYALACQVNPEITPERFWSLAMETRRTIELKHDGETIPLGPIVDPVALIGALKAPSATLTVQVVGEQGQGLNAAQVNIQNSVGTMIFSGVANEQGVASVEVLYGTYSVSVNYKGFTNTASLSVDSPITVQTIAVNVYVELCGYAMTFTTFVLWMVIIIVAVLIIVFLFFRKFIKPKTSAKT